MAASTRLTGLSVHEWTLLSRPVLACQGMLWITPGLGPLIFKQSPGAMTMAFFKARIGWGVHCPPDFSFSHSAGQLANLFSKFSLGVCLHSQGTEHKQWKPGHLSHPCHTILAPAMSSMT